MLPHDDEPPAVSDLSDSDLSVAAQTDACVLLTGRKDDAAALAYRIHSVSGWRGGPFVVVDCGVPEAALESSLFEAWPDAEAAAPGAEPRPRLAQSGTVLLQEVGRLSPAAQARLAERLETLTGTGPHRRPRRRLMASSSEPLLQRVDAGTFDDRLFYRLNVIHVILPLRAPAA